MKKQFTNFYKKVYLPHIRYTVIFADMKYLVNEEIKGSGFTTKTGEYECMVFLEDIEKTVKDISLMPYIAHELTHVIQFICIDMNMQIQEEQEHTAYIMHYLFEQLIS